jgi:hypothetical protein
MKTALCCWRRTTARCDPPMEENLLIPRPAGGRPRSGSMTAWLRLTNEERENYRRYVRGEDKIGSNDGEGE